MINKNYIQAKKGIKKNLFADVFTVSMYACSPYHACEHGCVYCDGRAERYYVEGEFDRDIVIRQNLAELLQNELPKLRELAPITIGSGALLNLVKNGIEVEYQKMQLGILLLLNF